MARLFSGFGILVVSFVLLASLPFLLCYSTLKVVLPEDLKKYVNGATGSTDDHIPEYSALFGQPDYGATVSQVVYYSNVPDGCATIDAASSGAQPNPATGGFYPFFLLIDRGHCNFANKVLNAQNAGAVGVVMANIQAPYPGAYGYGEQLIYMADSPDGLGKQISIPSQLIPKSYGDKLKTYLQGTLAKAVMLSMSFQTPSPDNRTEWELWTSSYFPSADLNTFYTTFDLVVDTLQARALFSPHYFLLAPTQLGCTVGNSCNNQCVAGGFCQRQPSDRTQAEITGAQIVKEDLRQLCVYNSELSANSQTVGKYWFKYVQLFQKLCVNVAAMKFTDQCAQDVLDSLASQYSDFAATNAPWVSNCMATNSLSDPSNPVLTWETNNQTIRWNTNYPIVPSLFINNDMFTGSVVCPKGVTVTCSIVDDICNGYAQGSKPAACNASPSSCPFGTPVDECGVCGGNGLKDVCGVCQARNSTEWNKSCAGCDGVVNSGKVVDNCGVCGGHSDSCSSSSVSVTGIIVGVIVGALVVFGVIAYFVQRQRMRMKADVNVLLQQYVPLAENLTVGPASGRNNTSNTTARSSVFPPRHNSDPDRAALVTGNTGDEDL